MVALKPNLLSRVISDITTTAAGDFCSSKIQGHILLVGLLMLSAYTVFYAKKDFDAMVFAGAGSTIMAATAGAQKLKDSTEPQPPAQTKETP